MYIDYTMVQPTTTAGYPVSPFLSSVTVVAKFNTGPEDLHFLKQRTTAETAGT